MESREFSRNQRLLTSRDFKITFDKATIRFSTPLLLVLVSEQSSLTHYENPEASVAEVPNFERKGQNQDSEAAANDTTQSGMPSILAGGTASKTKAARLGLVVAKKHLKRAVDRNRFKRLVRESFRAHQQQLEGLDVVVLARSGALRSIHNSNSDTDSVTELLNKAWRYIQRKRR